MAEQSAVQNAVRPERPRPGRPEADGAWANRAEADGPEADRARTDGLRAAPVGHSRLLGVGGYRPARVVGNAELGRLIGHPEEWITGRSGIVERRFAGPAETLAVMGAAAADKALARAGVRPADVDLVLLASTSNMLMTPPTAVRIAHELGAHGATGIDLSAACAGFCHALALAADSIGAGSAGHVLVVGAERMTDIVNPTDDSMAFLFADGAGAAVVGPADRPGIGPVARAANGRYFDSLRMSHGWDAYAGSPGTTERPWLRMDGRRVFRWAMEEVCPGARRALEGAGIAPGDLDVFVPHQSNARMIDLMAERLELGPRTVVSHDVARTGNTSSASVPLALEALLEAGEAGPGDTALLVGFGAGLNYAGQVVLLP
ncbi:beta-ketoacyl-ACP synthase 3 [Streptomyces sp. BE20]|uniref:beta-ketoacyl-ACP synthase 3 n=1 Tax=Streptomyces sp. BE20 TaxID=3002525 RepID=UPI002E75E964|nr:beta-ketoacyl-ACP synthase 3 [Streptomyces sp. BE20]MEE1828568.1 beta-ketoacyl-ACP synthase 3 [Streptomyces sp. BE20]